MFILQLRGTVATLIMAISLGTDFALLKLFAPLNSWIGYHSTFWIFSGICFANVFYLIWYVPETKMRSLEDIYSDLDGKKGKSTQNNNVWWKHTTIVCLQNLCQTFVSCNVIIFLYQWQHIAALGFYSLIDIYIDCLSYNWVNPFP